MSVNVKAKTNIFVRKEPCDLFHNFQIYRNLFNEFLRTFYIANFGFEPNKIMDVLYLLNFSQVSFDMQT